MIIEYKLLGKTFINLDKVTSIRYFDKTVCVTFVNGEDINFDSYEVTVLSWKKLTDLFDEC